MKKLILSAMTASVLFSSGCATILTEKTSSINVATSTGQKIQVTVDGQSHEVPGIVNVQKQNQNKVIVTDAEGCTSETALNKEVEPAFFINLLSGGVFGSSTDYGSEKMWKYQDSVTISCQQ
ncbi:adenosine deaminase [Alteromonas facilis]|uniref:adenosine deaminase n=1 Tax=Alteromonas facilis TaxID=2048004 RepID=UPI000C28DFE9|nr:adenosine deaminase [Alteromonas facilis]